MEPLRTGKENVMRLAPPEIASPGRVSGYAGVFHPANEETRAAMSDAPLPYRDPSRPLEDRIEDLLGRMTVPEKISQLLYISPAIDRLGVPAYNWWNECLHGVARNGRATVFPQAIGMAATFDDGLVKTVFRTIAHEARAKYAQSVLAGQRGQYRGLTFWTPNINIFRDPRWGRGQETYGEDPYLMTRMGLAVVNGLQGDDPETLLTAACAKHFAVHSGPEKLRHEFDAEVSDQDLHETYLPAFEALVKGGVETVMGAYNRVRGEPCCGSRFLLVDLLREAWGFQGHVVSDCWAIRDFHTHHKVTSSPEASAALALKMGCDLNCGCVYEDLPAAFQQGLVSEAQIDTSLRRLLSTRFRLGMFDETEASLREMAAGCEVGGEAHRALSRKTAAASMVLLRNREGVLPLRTGGLNLYLCGPNAASVDVLLGNYAGLNTKLTTILEGIAGAVDESCRIYYKPALLRDGPNLNGLDWSVGEAKACDVIIGVAGWDYNVENEEGDAIASRTVGDREDIGLPPHQYEYFLKVAKEAKKPLVLIVCAGSAVSLGELAEHAAAILYAWYPGEAGGEAVADVLFGRVSPSGRLPVTVPRGTAQLPPFEDYAMEGRTYRFLREDPEFPFGFGLGYTTFAYADATAEPAQPKADQTVTVSATVTNTGSRDADEVVQVYLRDLEASVRVPVAKLVGFRRVHLKAGESRRVEFEMSPDHMAVVKEDGSRAIEPGRFEVEIGGCSPGRRGQELGAPAPAIAEFVLG